MRVIGRRPSIGGILLGALALGAAVAALAQPGAGRPPQPPAIGDGPWDYATELGPLHVTLLTKDLQSPWSLAFLPNGDMLLTERPGRLRVIRGGRLDPMPIAGLPALDNASIGGLMGLALHPDFASNRLIYFAYSKPRPGSPEQTSLAVARARWDGGAALADVSDIFVAQDWYSGAMAAGNNRCCGQGPASGSYGARLTFDDAGMLYISSGDRNWGEKAQDPQSHLGKILRLHDDGSVPDDNPFVGMAGYLPEIYTLGHRNPTGLRFVPETGELWSTEFGPAGGDELNRIEAGKNYGWMLITEGEHYDGAPKALGSGGIDGYEDPVTWWPRFGNPGNVIVYTGDRFPNWQGNVFVAAMSRPGALVRITLDDEREFVAEERLLTDLGQRFRDVAQGPDGKIYVLTETGATASPGSIIVLEPGR